MDESPKPAEAAAHLYQGPHRADFADPEAVALVAPLRLTLLPQGPSVELRSSDQVLGRHSDCDFRLPMPDVSRRHCQFVYVDGGWEVIDLNSLNGLFVNGLRVARARLHHRSRIQIGGVTLEVSMPGEPALPGSNCNKVLRSISDALPQPTDAAHPERRRAS